MNLSTQPKRISVATGTIVGLFLILVSILTASADESISSAIARILEKGPAQYLGAKGHGYSSEEIDRRLMKFYQSRDFMPLWVSENGPGERGVILLSFLDGSFKEGLNPEDYYVERLHALWDDRDGVSLAKLEILLTLGLAQYVADAREGHMDPREADPKLFASARDKEIDMATLARAAIEASDLREFLEKQPPQHRYYKSLIPALARYREIAANGGWPTVPEGPSLRPGMTDPRIPVVRKRLSITGDLLDSDLTSEQYGEQLVQAVKRFQERHYLTADGVLGKNTLQAMNVSAEKRVHQIIINMERWRWTARNMEGKQIFVNIAAFHLVGMEGEELEIRMPVIVGKERHMTPVFSHAIEYAEFNPYWNVPVSIARDEYLPKLRLDAKALQDKNIRIFAGWDENAKEVDPTTIDWKNVSPDQMGRYRLRQDPGPRNALGTMKFIFPNAYSVYLHDTPSHSLFQREKRTFSHGCIRVSRPPELAVYILGSQEEGWTLERVKAIVDSRERKVVNLKKPMPVHIIYRTVVALDDGIVLFGEDVYGRDAILEKALF